MYSLAETFYGKELHPPFYNYMGPQTSLEKRFSLNYKRKGQGPFNIKKGTLSFWLPSTETDYDAFKHDLEYWSPESYMKLLADIRFLQNAKNIMGRLAITGQGAKRITFETIPIVFSAKALKSGIIETLEKLASLGSDAWTTARDNTDVYGAIEQIEDMLYEIAIDQDDYVPVGPDIDLDLEVGIEAEPIFTVAQQARLARLADIRAMPLNRRLIHFTSEFIKILPAVMLYGNLGYHTIGHHLEHLYNTVNNYFKLTDDYKEVKSNVDKVEQKFNEYLDEVGKFSPLSEQPYITKFIYGDEKNFDGPFKVKEFSEINKSKAQEKYFEFYEEFKKYALFMNNKYQGNPDYTPFELEPFNMDRLPIVSAPQALTQENLNSMELFNRTIEDLTKNVETTVTPPTIDPPAPDEPATPTEIVEEQKGNINITGYDTFTEADFDNLFG